MSTSVQVAFPGAFVPLTVTLTGSQGTNLVGVQFLAVCQNRGAGPVDCAQVNFSGAAEALPPARLSEPLSDGVIASVNYPVPAATVLGEPITLFLVNATGRTWGGQSLALASPPLTLPVITAVCLASIQASINFYLSLPAKLALDALQLRIKTGASTGTCQ